MTSRAICFCAKKPTLISLRRNVSLLLVYLPQRERDKVAFEPTLVSIDCKMTEQIRSKISFVNYCIFVDAAFVPFACQLTSYVMLSVYMRTWKCFFRQRWRHTTQRRQLAHHGINLISNNENPNAYLFMNAPFESAVLLVDGLLSHGLNQFNGTVNSYINYLETIFNSCYEAAQLRCPAPALFSGFETNRFHHPVTNKLI